MAVIFENSCCSLCRRLLGEEGFFATWGCAVAPEHPLFAHCDAPIHWRCYRFWPHREEFAAAYYEARRRWDNPFWSLLGEAEQWFVQVNPELMRVDVYFRQTGTSISFKRETWGQAPKLDPSQEALLSAGLADCFQCLGDWDSLWGRLDIKAHQQRILEWQEAENQLALERESARRAILDPHQVRWQMMLAELEAGSLRCPYCQVAHGNIKAYNRHPERKSIFICQVCAFSFDPDGLPDWHKLGG